MTHLKQTFLLAILATAPYVASAQSATNAGAVVVVECTATVTAHITEPTDAAADGSVDLAAHLVTDGLSDGASADVAADSDHPVTDGLSDGGAWQSPAVLTEATDTNSSRPEALGPKRMAEDGAIHHRNHAPAGFLPLLPLGDPSDGSGIPAPSYSGATLRLMP